MNLSLSKPRTTAVGAALRTALTLFALPGCVIAVAWPAGAAAKLVPSPIALRVLNAPNPVLGADNRMHLAYELQISNPYPAAMTLRRVQALANGRPIGVS